MDSKVTTILFASMFSGAALAAESADFHMLDQNNDGYVTRDEVSSDSAVTNDWDNLDANADDRLDQSEFARFEATGDDSSRSDGVPGNPPGTEGYDTYGGASGSDAPSDKLGTESGERPE